MNTFKHIRFTGKRTEYECTQIAGCIAKDRAKRELRTVCAGVPRQRPAALHLRGCPLHGLAVMLTQFNTELSVLLPCGHYLPQAELLRLAAQIAGKRSAGISRGPRPGTGRPEKLSLCPKCGAEFGVAAMRNHKCGTL